MNNTVNKDAVMFFIRLLLYDYHNYQSDEKLIERIMNHIRNLDKEN